MAIHFSDVATGLHSSEIRELLKLTEQPEMISFAGGLPAPELFPLEEMKTVDERILKEEGRQALQYGPTDGYGMLRRQISDRMNSVYNCKTTAEDILMISGSQQGLDMVGRVFLNKDDIVLMESPSYLGAINAFRLSGPKFIAVPTDEQGMIPEELDKILAAEKRVRMIYVIPDFQNPTGITWTLERRQKFMEIINRYEIPVIEDNPYGELRFEGEILPSLKSLDTKGLVVFLGTFSKIFAPGLRLGWICAAPAILEKCNMLKQAGDLQTSSFAQRQAAFYIDMFDLDAHIQKIKDVYKKRRDVMLRAIKENFPEEVKYTYPEGGLFMWVTLPEYMKAKDLMLECIEKKVAYVPGDSFYPNGGHYNMFRLNYSNMDEERIELGIKRIAEVIKKHMK